MANSLQDQLLKAGLVDKKKSKQISRQKKQEQYQNKKHKTGAAGNTDVAAIREAEKEKSRQLNRQREEAAQEKAIEAQIRQMIEQSRVSTDGGELAFNFRHDTLIKKLYVREQQQNQLERGNLGIVCFNDSYSLIPRRVAEKIAERNAALIVFLNEPGFAGDNQTDEDDPYKDYVIPDDLMW